MNFEVPESSKATLKDGNPAENSGNFYPESVELVAPAQAAEIVDSSGVQELQMASLSSEGKPPPKAPAFEFSDFLFAIFTFFVLTLTFFAVFIVIRLPFLIKDAMWISTLTTTGALSGMTFLVKFLRSKR
jgi:hypothetical protein